MPKFWNMVSARLQTSFNLFNMEVVTNWTCLIVIIVFLMTFFGLIIVERADILWYINPISALLSPVLSFFLCFAAFTPLEIWRSYAAAFKKESDSSALKTGVEYFRTFQLFLALTSVFASIVGLILILGNLSDQEAIGPGLATMIISPLYAVMIMIMVTVPFRAALRKKIAQAIEG